MDFVPVNWDRTGKASMKVDHGFSDGKPWLSYCAILRLRTFTKHVLIIFQGQTDVPIFRKIPILIPPKWCFFLLFFFFEVLISDLGIKSFDAFQIQTPLGGQRPSFPFGIFPIFQDVKWREMTWHDVNYPDAQKKILWITMIEICDVTGMMGIGFRESDA